MNAHETYTLALQRPWIESTPPWLPEETGALPGMRFPLPARTWKREHDTYFRFALLCFALCCPVRTRSLQMRAWHAHALALLKTMAGCLDLAISRCSWGPMPVRWCYKARSCPQRRSGPSCGWCLCLVSAAIAQRNFNPRREAPAMTDHSNAADTRTLPRVAESHQANIAQLRLGSSIEAIECGGTSSTQDFGVPFLVSLFEKHAILSVAFRKRLPLRLRDNCQRTRIW